MRAKLMNPMTWKAVFWASIAIVIEAAMVFRFWAPLVRSPNRETRIRVWVENLMVIAFGIWVIVGAKLDAWPFTPFNYVDDEKLYDAPVVYWWLQGTLIWLCVVVVLHYAGLLTFRKTYITLPRNYVSERTAWRDKLSDTIMGEGTGSPTLGGLLLRSDVTRIQMALWVRTIHCALLAQNRFLVRMVVEQFLSFSVSSTRYEPHEVEILWDEMRHFVHNKSWRGID